MPVFSGSAALVIDAPIPALSSTALVGGFDPTNNFVQRRFALGNQDCVGTRRHSRMKSDPTHVTPHDFRDHASVVRVTGRTKAIHGVGGNVHRCIKTECVIGGRKIVVDCLGDTNNFYACLGQTIRRRESSLTADDQQTIHASVCHDLIDAVDTAIVFEWIRSRRTEYRPA
jgi:hypothetical protein